MQNDSYRPCDEMEDESDSAPVSLPPSNVFCIFVCSVPFVCRSSWFEVVPQFFVFVSCWVVSLLSCSLSCVCRLSGWLSCVCWTDGNNTTFKTSTPKQNCTSISISENSLDFTTYFFLQNTLVIAFICQLCASPVSDLFDHRADYKKDISLHLKLIGSTDFSRGGLLLCTSAHTQQNSTRFVGRKNQKTSQDKQKPRWQPHTEKKRSYVTLGTQYNHRTHKHICIPALPYPPPAFQLRALPLCSWRSTPLSKLNWRMLPLAWNR